jgi:uncharacterized protein
MLFNRAKSIEGNIDKYLENILKAGLSFEAGMKEYFENKLDQFEERSEEVQKLESESDEMRREIKYKLYKELLIPDARGDVLGLLETLDNVIDTIEMVMIRFSIEKPIIWPELKDDFLELTNASVKCVFELVAASRAFFIDISKVPDYLVQVHFWEHEADKIEERIMRKAFEGNFIDKLSHKVHMRYFAERISLLADEAEDVADRLDIYTIKRSI